MTLKEAMRIGKVCGLETVDEAVLNVELSAMQIFPYEDISILFSEMIAIWIISFWENLKYPKNEYGDCSSL